MYLTFCKAQAEGKWQLMVKYAHFYNNTKKSLTGLESKGKYLNITYGARKQNLNIKRLEGIMFGEVPGDVECRF